VDGVVVVNTGDSLVVLSVQMEKNNSDGGVGGGGGPGGYAYGAGGMYSPRIAPSESYLSSGGASPVSTGGGGGQPGGSTPGSAYGGEIVEEDLLSTAATAQILLPHFTGSPPPHWCYQGTGNPSLSSTTAGGSRATGGVVGMVPARDATNVPNTSSSTFLDHRGGGQVEQRYNITGKENQIVRQLGSPLASSVAENSLPLGGGYHDGSPNTSLYRGDAPAAVALRPHKSPFDVYNFEGSTPKRDEDNGGESSDYFPRTSECFATSTDPSTSEAVNYTGTNGGGMAPSRASARSVPGYRLGSYRLGGARLRGGEAHTVASAVGSQNLAGFDEFQFVETTNDDDNDKPTPRGGCFEKPSTLLPARLQVRGENGITQRLLPNLSFASPSSELYMVSRGGWGGAAGAGGCSGNMALSPGYGRLDQGGSSTCSSCISSPIILQNESKCFTFSIRRYVETSVTANPRPESPADGEGG